MTKRNPTNITKITRKAISIVADEVLKLRNRSETRELTKQEAQMLNQYVRTLLVAAQASRKDEKIFTQDLEKLTDEEIAIKVASLKDIQKKPKEEDSNNE